MWSAKWLWDATSRFTLGQSCVVLTNATHSTALAFYAWEIPPRFPAECHLSLLSKFGGQGPDLLFLLLCKVSVYHCHSNE